MRLKWLLVNYYGILLLLVNMEFLNSFITLIGLHVILGLFTAVSKRMRYVTTYAITQYIIVACIVPLLIQSKYKLSQFNMSSLLSDSPQSNNRKDHSLWVTPFIPRERPNVKHAIAGYLRLPQPKIIARYEEAAAALG